MSQRLSPIAVFMFLALAAGLAGAQSDPFEGSNSLGTPDGIPPSGEHICDDLTGAPYGLCTAFCEAMDCDSDNPNANQAACDRVSSRFEQITGEQPPCVSSCICATDLPGYIDSINAGIDGCFDDPGFGVVELYSVDGRVPASQSFQGTNSCGFAYGTGGFIFITEEEALACNDFLRAKAADAGVPCGTV